MRYLLVLVLYFVIFFLLVPTVSYVKYGGYISGATEEKYYNALPEFKYIADGLFSHPDHINFGFIGDSPYKAIDPFHKWYIHEVGSIRPGSRIAKYLDSVSATINFVNLKK